jgi:hypothetical protein
MGYLIRSSILMFVCVVWEGQITKNTHQEMIVSSGVFFPNTPPKHVIFVITPNILQNNKTAL